MELTRRTFLQGACCGTLAAATTRLWTPSAAFAQDPTTVDGALVVVFLRGAMDGLSAVVPWADEAYHRLRPTIAIPTDRVIDLDGRFGLHPSLEPLKDLYDAGDLALVHAAGSLEDTRSHFDAQEVMERGTTTLGGGTGSGWLARHVAATDVTAIPLHAMAWGTVPPASLRGDVAALSLSSLDSFSLATYPAEMEATRTALTTLYEGQDGILKAPGRAALRALDTVASVRDTAPLAAAVYPETHLGRSLADIARTIKADVGLSTATVDVGGWDLHANAGLGAQGTMADNLEDLGTSLRAFHDDLGERMGSTTLVVMSEFGRRVEENGSNGTDHGAGNCMFVLGGGIRGGAVYGDWLPLDPDNLHRGDVPVLTDYRDIVGEVTAARHGAAATAVFPDLTPAFKGLT